jgi:hypothetical protein
MPIRTALWQVGTKPSQLEDASLPAESLLEDMIVAAPGLLAEDWLLIGRQEITGLGGRIDLLAIAPDASLVLIELKRDRTPRDVVAQAIDYASWVDGLKPEDIDGIYGRFAPGRSLASDFHQRFEQELDEDALNRSHQIVVVASSLDASTERIVAYLNERDIPINVLCFQVFEYGEEQLLSRVWLHDPTHVQVNAGTAPRDEREPWNGEFYASFGESEARSWAEAMQNGFICAGGSAWYNRTLKLLSPGDRIWVNVPGQGFVGVGRVKGSAVPLRDFVVAGKDGESPVVDLVTATYHRDQIDDLDDCEYFVAVDWLQTVTIEEAYREVGFFGNQNSVCKPTTSKWRHTVNRLKERFPRHADR